LLIIFGFRTAVRLLGIVTVSCRRCGNPAAHRLEERRRTFTVFFVPLIPLGRRSEITCTYCGLLSDVADEHVPALLTQAHDHSATPPRTGVRPPDAFPGGRPFDRP
jgi:hypothetical protein